MQGWNIVRTKPRRKTYGRALPAFIHNGDYFLATVAAYADGAIDCWGFVDLALFEEKVKAGWVVTRAPARARLSIHNLGHARVGEGRWEMSAADLVEQVRQVIRELNPEGRGLIDMEGDDTEIRSGIRYAKLGLANAKPYRMVGRGKETRGAELPVFRKAAEGYHLVRWFLYADGLSQLGPSGELLSTSEAAGMLARGLLATAVPDGSWVTIEGLGRFRTADGFWYVEPGEWACEADDLRTVLGGKPSAIQTCIERHTEYERKPTAARRAALRRAYEAVPQHLRRYCGDMDSKDGPIRQILYGEEG
jgi:hypothetical protein